MDRSASTHPVGTKAVDLARVRALVEPIAAAHGVSLCDVEWTSGPAGRILRLVIERPAAAADQLPGSVTVEDCARVSRDASTALDVDDPIAVSYHLEVSSPGLDRPLRGADDFRRALGRLAKVKLRRPAPDGQVVLRGQLVGAAATGIRIAVDGNEHDVAHEDIAEAKLVPDFGAPAARGRAPRHPPGGSAARSPRAAKRPGAARKAKAGSGQPASRKGS